MHELEIFLLSKPGISKPGKKSPGMESHDSLISEQKMNKTFDLVIKFPEKLNIYIHEFYKAQGYSFRENGVALMFVKEREALAIIISPFRDRTRFSVDPLE